LVNEVGEKSVGGGRVVIDFWRKGDNVTKYCNANAGKENGENITCTDSVR